MFKTTTVTELRANLSSMLADLDEGPVLILSHNVPAALLIDPGMFEMLNQKVELLEDLLNGRQAIDDYVDDPDIAFDAKEVFKRIRD